MNIGKVYNLTNHKYRVSEFDRIDYNILFVGPPGSSKTMLARRMPTILPPLTLEESLDTTRIYSVVGEGFAHPELVRKRPFRSPHHTSSGVALVGGGSTPQPGEISMAHHGVLFLDELPEFRRAALEVLREPLEEGKITISRAKATLEFPSSFMLVASMNPCPCGYYNHPTRKCTCSQASIRRYLSRLSGPLLDRIDLQLQVSPVPLDHLDKETPGESSAQIRKRVAKARHIQMLRNTLERGRVTNARLTSKQVAAHCQLEPDGKRLLHKSIESLQLSARAYERILKVCRTIADLEGCVQIAQRHVVEAIHYRCLDRQMQQQSPVGKLKALYPDRIQLTQDEWRHLERRGF